MSQTAPAILPLPHRDPSDSMIDVESSLPPRPGEPTSAHPSVVNYHRRVSEVNAIGSQVTCALRASVERAKQGVRAVEEVIKAVKRSQDLEIEEVNALLDEDVADTLDDIEYTDEPQTVESVDADAPTMPRTRTPDGMDRIMDRFAVPSTK